MLPLQEYVLRISPQALVHAHLFYIKAARSVAIPLSSYAHDVHRR
jgi:hypothetical protein